MILLSHWHLHKTKSICSMITYYLAGVLYFQFSRKFCIFINRLNARLNILCKSILMQMMAYGIDHSNLHIHKCACNDTHTQTLVSIVRQMQGDMNVQASESIPCIWNMEDTDWSPIQSLGPFWCQRQMPPFRLLVQTFSTNAESTHSRRAFEAE